MQYARITIKSKITAISLPSREVDLVGNRVEELEKARGGRLGGLIAPYVVHFHLARFGIENSNLCKFP